MSQNKQGISSVSSATASFLCQNMLSTQAPDWRPQSHIVICLSYFLLGSHI